MRQEERALVHATLDLLLDALTPAAPLEAQRFLDEAAVVAKYGIERRALAGARKRGELSAGGRGRHVFYATEEVEHWIASAFAKRTPQAVAPPTAPRRRDSDVVDAALDADLEECERQLQKAGVVLRPTDPNKPKKLEGAATARWLSRIAREADPNITSARLERALLERDVDPIEARREAAITAEGFAQRDQEEQAAIDVKAAAAVEARARRAARKLELAGGAPQTPAEAKREQRTLQRKAAKARRGR